MRRQAEGTVLLIPPDTGSLRGDLIMATKGIASALNREGQVSLVDLVEAVRDHEELRETIHSQLEDASQTVGDAIYANAAKRGELHIAGNVPAVVMLALSHLLYTALFTDEILDEQHCQHLVDSVCIPLLTSTVTLPATPAD